MIRIVILILIFILGISYLGYSQNIVVEYIGVYQLDSKQKILPVKYRLDIINDSISLFSNRVMEDSVLDKETSRTYYKLDRNTSYFNDIHNGELSLIKPNAGSKILLTNANLYEWKLTKENKIINGYKCYNALGKVMGKFDFGTFKGSSKSFYSIVAWYCPTISPKFGPSNYIGLPGLVFSAINSRGMGFQIESMQTVDHLEITFDEFDDSEDYLEYYKRFYRRFKSR